MAFMSFHALDSCYKLLVVSTCYFVRIITACNTYRMISFIQPMPIPQTVVYRSVGIAMEHHSLPSQGLDAAKNKT